MFNKCLVIAWRFVPNKSAICAHDMIVSGELYSFHCEDCKEIVDVLYPYGKKPEKSVCPECGSENLKKWNPKTGKCPKCGGEMKKTDITLLVD